MGMEVAGSDLPKVNGEVKTKLNDKEVGEVKFSEAITFGSHGVDEVETKGEENASNANISKDNAADEWPEVQCHYFWFVKHRPFEDPSLKAKIDITDKEIQKYQEQLNKLFEELDPKMSEKKELYDVFKVLTDENTQYKAFITEKREEMKPLQNALGTLRGGGGEKGFGICSTEEELNQLIRNVEYRMQHESLSLKEEKQLLKEIKELEATRPKVIANIAERAKIQEAMGQKEALLDQVKSLGTDVDGVRKQQAAVRAKGDSLAPRLDVLKAQIQTLKAQRDLVKGKKTAALATMRQLREQREKENSSFNEYRRMFTNAKEIAVKKDVKALEELCYAEVEKFMFQWNSSKAFRDDYEKKILKSLDYRQLSRDGRIRNFDEKPLVMAEPPRPEMDVVSEATSKQPKEAAKTTSKVENLPAEKAAQKESKKGNKVQKSASERAVEEEEEDVFVVEKPKDVQNVNETDTAKLREMKKEEEKEKQRQAFERKKKLQEKAAAKAAARAQKEAEKKQKEREKKLKKKEASTSQPNNEEEPTEKSETDEPEKSDNVEEAVDTPTPSKAKVQPNTLRNRKPIKSRGAPPKAILKKKKSDKYLLWGSAAAAALGVLLLLVLGYKYFL